MLDPLSRRLVALALEEDLGAAGDLTSRLLPDALEGAATVLAKQDLVLSGGPAFEEVFRQLDPRVEVTMSPGGTRVKRGEAVGHIRGPARSLLSGERTALNFIQRLCGVATYTAECVAAVAGTKTAIVDTRKTTPGLRALQKQAVRDGGGRNHRFGLYDGILIKDNHVAAAGGVAPAIAAARQVAHHLVRVECEVTDLDELEAALAAGADVILLDNMSLERMTEAVARTAGRAILEASGNMTLARLPAVAATGVDFISLGALTHSAPAADLSLEWA